MTEPRSPDAQGAVDSGKKRGNFVDAMPSPVTFALAFAGLVITIGIVIANNSVQKGIEFAAFGSSVTAGVFSIVASQTASRRGPFNSIAAALLCLGLAFFVEYQYPNRWAIFAFIGLGVFAATMTLMALLALTSLRRHPVESGMAELRKNIFLTVLTTLLLDAWLVFAYYVLP